ncbi:aldose epimerase family protein [Vibrio sp. WXL210]|uniref:aldose epimerase family protein n=1 Tax=Vibrio sp. WXL210 TaxID=3450709 RepID=UPI003EC775D4
MNFNEYKWLILIMSNHSPLNNLTLELESNETNANLDAESHLAWGDYRLFTLRNSNDIQVDISDLGATIVNFYVHDRMHRKINITLGYDSPQGYLDGQAYIGGIVGPWANRIDNGCYTHDNNEVRLEKNEANNHLHGGSAGLHKKCWDLVLHAEQGLTLRTRVKRGQAGYPANIDIYVTYRLTDNNELSIQYFANADSVTAINLTNHAYFNLSGRNHDISNHLLTIDADSYWDVNKSSIPTQCLPVAQTRMDFRQPIRIGEAKSQGATKRGKNKDFDHCWNLNGQGLRSVAWLYENNTGIGLEVSTDQKGLQFYAGAGLDEAEGRDGHYGPYSGLCLEAQAIPNQVNMDNADEVIYGPDKQYSQITIYRVEVKQL